MTIEVQTNLRKIREIQIALDSVQVFTCGAGVHTCTYQYDTTTNGLHTAQATVIYRNPGSHRLRAKSAQVVFNAGNAPPVTDPPPAGGPGSEPLLRLENLVYQGAFRLPRGSFGSSPTGRVDSFAFGGTALAYNNNSLFLVGHPDDQMIAEISIPAVVNSQNLSSLKTATVLQGPVEATEGKMSQAGPVGATIGGLMVYGGKLYGTVYIYFDAGGSQQVSHFIRPLNLATTGQVQGLFQVNAPTAGFVAGYLSLIPSEWRAALGGPAFTGQCCLSIISRTSYGPAAFVFDPAQVGVTSPVPSVALVYYENFNGDQHFISDWNVQSTFFNNTTMMGGAVFVPGTRSVLFAGRQGIGPFVYGCGSPLNPPPPLDASCPDGYAYDPVYPYKGAHAYPYVYQIWAYDARDLASVTTGAAKPWTVKPYAVWTLNLPFGVAAAEIKGVAYDATTHRLFLTQAFGDGGDMPIVYVFQENF